jgi:S-adenosylmethionine:tRNA ribosyltransferase-isomerase
VDFVRCMHPGERDESGQADIRDFSYVLPAELIAQVPIEPRDASRLLVVDRASNSFAHRHFRDLGEYLRPGDLLLANQSRVIPARLLGRREGSGGHVELLLLASRPDLGADIWETLVRPGRRLREGSCVLFGPDGQPPLLQAEILQRTEAGGRLVCLTVAHNPVVTSVRAAIEHLGRMPLPPYIHETLRDPERYQTVYSRVVGSAAAPTAGLHFTPELLDQLRARGVRLGFVTLHVGLDTFRPVEVEDFREHTMHSEEIDLDEATVACIEATIREGGRIIAVGTTVVRVLEGIASLSGGQLRPYHGTTRLFITPGYRFRMVDALITNFHLPRSTLLLLVSAFAGKTLIERAYQEAIDERYRFFSFGDAMLLL